MRPNEKYYKHFRVTLHSGWSARCAVRFTPCPAPPQKKATETQPSWPSPRAPSSRPASSPRQPHRSRLRHVSQFQTNLRVLPVMAVAVCTFRLNSLGRVQSCRGHLTPRRDGAGGHARKRGRPLDPAARSQSCRLPLAAASTLSKTRRSSSPRRSSLRS